MIKFLAMDVDGTLTDGKVYMGNDGEVFKAFDIKDGYGIKEVLPHYGIIPIIITARNSEILNNRCRELDITEIHQGVRNKIDCLKEIIAKYSAEEIYSLENVAYVGDDILDIQCMAPIKQAGGLAACPSDAVRKVRECCDYVSVYKGGNGAIRDIIEHIIEQEHSVKESFGIIPESKLEQAIEYIRNLKYDELEIGKHIVNDEFFYLVQEYELSDDTESIYESHKKYIDIQWVVNGTEKLLVTDIKNLKISIPYDVAKDVMFYENSDNKSALILTEGSCAVLFPKDAHRVQRVNGTNGKVQKVVGKLRVDMNV